MTHATRTIRSRALRLRIPLAGVVSLALALPLLGPVAAGASAPAAAPTAKPAPRVAVSDAVPVLVSLGDAVDMPGATVQALDSKGKVLQTATVDGRGGALLSRAKVAKAVSLRVTGGTATNGIRNNTVLTGPLSLDKAQIRVQFVNPITTLIDRVSSSRKVNRERARQLVLKHLGIPLWTRPWQYSITGNYFDPVLFAAYVESKGGLKQALSSLERETTRRTATRSFTGHRPQARGLASFAGQMLFTATVEGATGQSPDSLIGSLMGVQDPTASILEDIAQELATITTMLVDIEADMQEMLTQIQIAQYQTIASSMATIIGNTENQWVNYNYLVNNIDPNDRATYQEYADDFYSGINPYIGQFNQLWTTAGSTGLLDELYTMNATAYPWWTDSDITNMQSTVDYYGTMQAEAVTLLSEAWNFSGPGYTHTMTKSYINGQLTGLYQTQNNNIYKSMPDSVGYNEVVNPGNRAAYRTSAYTQPNGALKEVAASSPTCSSYQDTSNHYKTPQVSASTISGWWASATPSGYTTANSSDLNFLSGTRTIDGTSQNALPTIRQGLSNPWALVTAQTQPLMALRVTYSGANATYSFYGWMYCGGNAVSLNSSLLSKFQKDPVMALGGPYSPTPAWNSTIPVGVLVTRTGHWRYVAP